MNYLCLLVGLITSISVSQAIASDDTFDVPNGKFSTLYSGALAPDTVISCDFSIDEVFYGSKWIPMVSIVFSETNDTDDDTLYFKLSASRSEKDEGWRHKFRVQHADDRETITTAKSGVSEFVLPMTMMLDDERYVLFFVGEEPDELSMFDASTFPVSWWEVNASGVKGSGDCDSRLIDHNDDE